MDRTGNEEFFLSVIENSSDIILVLDHQGVISYASPSVERYLGYTVKEMTGKKATAFIHPDEGRRARAEFARAFAEFEASTPNSFRVLHKNGTERILEGMGRHLRGQSDMQGFIMNIHDVTERKAAEYELNQKNKHLHFLNTLAGTLAELATDDNLPLFLTQKLKEFTGAIFVTYSSYDPDKKGLVIKHIETEESNLNQAINHLGINLHNIFTPINDEIYHEMTHQVVTPHQTLTTASFGAINNVIDGEIKAITGTDYFYEICYIVAGELFGTSLLGFHSGIKTPSPDLMKSFAHLAAVSLRRRKTQEELEKNERIYRNLVEMIPDGIYKSTHSGKFVDVNPAMIKMLGYANKEELISIDIKTELYFDPTDRESLILQEHLEELGVYPLRKKDGSAIWVEDHGWYTTDDNGEILFHEGILRDVTERKQAEAKIARQTEELIALNATKDKFFSIIAHDLRSPFNSIQGFTDVLLSDYKNYNELEIAKILKMINASSKHAFELLENLLLWARTQTGNTEFHPEIIDLREKIISNIQLIEIQAEHKNIALSCLVNDPIEVFADRNMMGTILRNLLTNAIKFTQKNGQVWVTATRKDKLVEISVVDTGIGMSQENVENVFRIDKKTTTLGTEKEKGSGIGLILCKEFVGRQGGTLWVESEPGHGSKFTFTVPVK